MYEVWDTDGEVVAAGLKYNQALDMLEEGYFLNQFTTISGVLYYTDAWVMVDGKLEHLSLED